MQLFLSYASEQRDLASDVYQALLQEGHKVFFDQSELRAAGGYHAKIREEVKRSDGFVFLISPASLAKGCYTLTELAYAKKKWKDPTGHVLPVMIEPMPMQSVDSYLRAVSIMTPQGNTAAEIADAISELRSSEYSVDNEAVRAAADLPFYIKCTNKQLSGAARELRVRYALTAGAVFVGIGVFTLAWLFPPLAQLKEIASAGGTAISSLAAFPAKGIMPARAKLGALELLCTGFESIPPTAASSKNERMNYLINTFYKLLDAELGASK